MLGTCLSWSYAQKDLSKLDLIWGWHRKICNYQTIIMIYVFWLRFWLVGGAVTSSTSTSRNKNSSCTVGIIKGIAACYGCGHISVYACNDFIHFDSLFCRLTKSSWPTLLFSFRCARSELHQRVFSKTDMSSPIIRFKNGRQKPPAESLIIIKPFWEVQHPT